jgi:hypothetical protein
MSDNGDEGRLICRQWITLRNGKRYSRPDGKPICWMEKTRNDEESPDA